MSTNTTRKVLTGPWQGKTKAELTIILRDLQDQLAAGGATLTSASTNGQSWQKTPGPSVTTQIRTVQLALAQVDPDMIAPSSQIAVRFRNPGCF